MVKNSIVTRSKALRDYNRLKRELDKDADEIGEDPSFARHMVYEDPVIEEQGGYTTIRFPWREISHDEGRKSYGGEEYTVWSGDRFVAGKGTGVVFVDDVVKNFWYFHNEDSGQSLLDVEFYAPRNFLDLHNLLHPANNDDERLLLLNYEGKNLELSRFALRHNKNNMLTIYPWDNSAEFRGTLSTPVKRRSLKGFYFKFPGTVDGIEYMLDENERAYVLTQRKGGEVLKIIAPKVGLRDVYEEIEAAVKNPYEWGLGRDFVGYFQQKMKPAPKDEFSQ